MQIGYVVSTTTRLCHSELRMALSRHSLGKKPVSQAVIARSAFCDEAIPNVAGDCFAALAMTQSCLVS